MAIN
jgi:hypothetical protein